MSKQVVGAFDSESQVIEVVERLESEGHRAEDITLIAKDVDTTSWLRKETSAHVDTAEGHVAPGESGEPSFWEKVKAAFKGDTTLHGRDPDNIHKELTEFGLTQEQAEKHESDVKNGKVLIMAPHEPARGLGAESEIGENDKNEKNVGAPPYGEGTSRAGDPLNPQNPPTDEDKREKF
ncbi:general stress protein [Alkalicoccus daliensis]|uniref:Heat induced stress protein YflT n=1 Tax=Alkalicoccus daliensis TaxID=745820 RepID=A0A1H0E344_9BACI|nr:general stress protein [Alkalicoccus daliensis]SDN76805.1 Heat induced stress protein YflT [Alkalicoccus daliensis]